MRTKEQWAEVFAGAKHGHILWDGREPDPCNPEHAYTSAHRFLDHAKYLGFFGPGNVVLDLGCGNGRFGICFSEMDVSYTGIDPVRECVLFCRQAFAGYPHLRFLHADVQNEIFNPSGTIPPTEYRLPFPDSSVDDVICYSVFTHLQTLDVARAYMAEIKRCLKVGGKFFCDVVPEPSRPEGERILRQDGVQRVGHPVHDDRLLLPVQLRRAHRRVLRPVGVVFDALRQLVCRS